MHNILRKRHAAVHQPAAAVSGSWFTLNMMPDTLPTRLLAKNELSQRDALIVINMKCAVRPAAHLLHVHQSVTIKRGAYKTKKIIISLKCFFSSLSGISWLCSTVHYSEARGPYVNEFDECWHRSQSTVKPQIKDIPFNRAVLEDILSFYLLPLAASDKSYCCSHTFCVSEFFKFIGCL